MKINDREYTIPELNFNAMCELEDLGASFSEMDKKALSTVRAFLALAMGGDAEKRERNRGPYRLRRQV